MLQVVPFISGSEGEVVTVVLMSVKTGRQRVVWGVATPEGGLWGVCVNIGCLGTV